MLSLLKKIIPKSLFRAGQPAYHFLWAIYGRIRYGNPSQNLTVIGVTGTKGKSTVTEVLAKIFEEAGHPTALSNTIHFKIKDKETPNTYKMSMPGRGFMHKFLREAVNTGCTHAVIEITSEGAKQFRHKFIELDALVFTNLSPEHIESHGSYEKYRDAKLSIARELARSSKKEKYMIANTEDVESPLFFESAGDAQAVHYSKESVRPYNFTGSISFTFENEMLASPLSGEFNIENLVAATVTAHVFGIPTKTIKNALSKITEVSGRNQKIEAGQNFTVIVDYAHTADSLEKLYKTYDGQRRVCVLGNTGGGRDAWKRPEMAKVADRYCDEIILTNEDPYDEDPQNIIDDMLPGFTKHTPDIIMDRRLAIRKALGKAQQGDVVLITGKGTDPYIMEASGTKTPWSDAEVAREELKNLDF